MARPGKGEWELFQKKVWRRPSFLELDADARLLYLWTWTHENAALCGLYEVSPRKLESALEHRDAPDAGLRDRVAAALQQLARKPLVLYDDDMEVLWVVGRVEHVNMSPTGATRMRREWERCPPSPLRDQFAHRYGAALGISNGRPA